MYAVVKSGGKQYRVEEGSELVVEKLDAGVGDAIDFDVLFFSDGTNVVADPASVSTASVTAEVVEQFRGEKVVVFKFKRRKGYKRTKGHRQELTRVKVTGISAPKGGAKKAARKPAKKAEPEAKAEEVVEEPAAQATTSETKAPKPAEKKAAKAKEEPKAPEAAQAAPEADAEPERCEALTGSGDRCKNKAKEGSKYCGVHAKKYEG